MSLKKLGVYNDFSDELKKAIALPKKGTQISYRFLDIYFDPMSGESFYKAHLKIPPFSKCFDPGKNEWIEIGLINGIDSYGNPLPNTSIVYIYPKTLSENFLLNRMALISNSTVPAFP